MADAQPQSTLNSTLSIKTPLLAFRGGPDHVSPASGPASLAPPQRIEKARPSLRINPANPNHHLWNNHGVWWVHLTLHLPDYTKRRVRRSLATSHLGTARQRRDAFLRRAGMLTGMAASKTAPRAKSRP